MAYAPFPTPVVSRSVATIRSHKRELGDQTFFVPSAPEVFLVEDEPGTTNPEGTARDINEPGIEELTDIIEPDITETLAAVTEAVSSVAASLDAVDGVMATRGKGAGDNRKC